MNGNKRKNIKFQARAAALVRAFRSAVSFLRANILTEAGILATFFVLFASSILFLDMKIGRDLDPDIGKNWWAVSFEDRDPWSVAFSIENHSDRDGFSYSVSRNKIVLDAGTVSIGKGERKIIAPKEDGGIGRTTITVESDDGSKKSIYRER